MPERENNVFSLMMNQVLLWPSAYNENGKLSIKSALFVFFMADYLVEWWVICLDICLVGWLFVFLFFIGIKKQTLLMSGFFQYACTPADQRIDRRLAGDVKRGVSSVDEGSADAAGIQKGKVTHF